MSIIAILAKPCTPKLSLTKVKTNMSEFPTVSLFPAFSNSDTNIMETELKYQIWKASLRSSVSSSQNIIGPNINASKTHAGIWKIIT